MRKCIFIVILIVSFFPAAIVLALTDGTYYNTSQQGIEVYFYQGYYEILLNGNTYDSGSYSVSGSTLVFSSSNSKSQPNGTIIGNCSFTWGAAGDFQIDNCNGGGGSLPPGTNGQQYATLDSNLNLNIPQLEFGGYQYSVTMALMSDGYQNYYFILTVANQITPFTSNYMATLDNSGLLYIPFLEIIGGEDYEVDLQLTSTTPDILFSILGIYDLNGNTIYYDDGSSYYGYGGSSGSSSGSYYSGYDPNVGSAGYNDAGNYGYNNPTGGDEYY